jgi:prepilin-type N-terminal cleavage/methylation domain-containing protein
MIFFPKLNQNGVSLVEILLAVVILGVGVVGVLRPMINAADGMRYLETRYSGGLVLKQKLWELQDEVAYSKRRMNLNRVETLQAGQRIFDYEVSMNAIEGIENLYSLFLRLSWAQGGRRKNLFKEFYLSFPESDEKKDFRF